MITPRQSHRNRIAGSGILLPTRSMPSRIRCIRVCGAAASGPTTVSVTVPALRELAEEGRLEGDGVLELLEQHALVRGVDVGVAVGGADEQALRAGRGRGERVDQRDRA